MADEITNEFVLIQSNPITNMSHPPTPSQDDCEDIDDMRKADRDDIQRRLAAIIPARSELEDLKDRLGPLQATTSGSIAIAMIQDLINTFYALTQQLMLLHLKTSPQFESSVDVFHVSPKQANTEGPDNNTALVTTALVKRTLHELYLTGAAALQIPDKDAEVTSELRAMMIIFAVLDEVATVWSNLAKKLEEINILSSEIRKQLKLDDVYY